MSDEQLREANEIQRQIRQLDNFLFYGERVWTGELVKRVPLITVKSHSYGMFGEAVYELDTETKNEVLEFLKAKRSKLHERLSEF